MGIKPYACDQPGCTYRATQKSNVKAHRRRVHKVDSPMVVVPPGDARTVSSSDIGQSDADHLESNAMMVGEAGTPSEEKGGDEGMEGEDNREDVLQI